MDVPSTRKHSIIAPIEYIPLDATKSGSEEGTVSGARQTLVVLLAGILGLPHNKASETMMIRHLILYRPEQRRGSFALD
jgi:hypothetical protein